MGRKPARRRQGDRKKAVAYVRVSTDRERQALGAEAQRRAIEAWAARERVKIVAWHVEEVTGGAPLDKRPTLLAALAEVLAQRAGLLVVAKLDRFSRDPLTAALAELELQRNGAALACADGNGSGDDPTSEMVRGMLLVVARFEKAMIRARIKAALAVKKARGEMTGAPPFGCRTVDGPIRVGKDGVPRAVKVLEPDPDETKIRNAVRALRASGMTVRAVAAEAEGRGFVGRTGKPFTLAAVHAMVKDVEPSA